MIPMSKTPRTKPTILIVATEYEGDDFPEARHWLDYVLKTTKQIFPEFKVTVMAGSKVSVTVKSTQTDEDDIWEMENNLTHCVKCSWWEAFCDNDYKQYEGT